MKGPTPPTTALALILAMLAPGCGPRAEEAGTPAAASEPAE